MKKMLLVVLSCQTILLLVFIFWKASSFNPPTTKIKNTLEPTPSFSPQEVVNIQLKAMQKNDEPYENHGIEIAYRFASPSNKESTGSITSFTTLVNNDTYHALLNFQQYGLDDIDIEGDKALQKVTLIDANDQPVVYFFQLSRQKKAPYIDCWMTDGVIRF